MLFKYTIFTTMAMIDIEFSLGKTKWTCNTMFRQVAVDLMFFSVPCAVV